MLLSSPLPLQEQKDNFQREIDNILRWVRQKPKITEQIV